MNYYTRFVRALKHECAIIRQRTQGMLIEAVPARVEESLQPLEPMFNQLEPASLFRAGYELGVADALSRLELTEEDILRVLNTAMRPVK